MPSKMLEILSPLVFFYLHQNAFKKYYIFSKILNALFKKVIKNQIVLMGINIHIYSVWKKGGEGYRIKIYLLLQNVT